MKIAKARLRQIIEEELLKEDEAAAQEIEVQRSQEELEAQIADVQDIAGVVARLESIATQIEEADIGEKVGSLASDVDTWAPQFRNAIRVLKQHVGDATENLGT